MAKKTTAGPALQMQFRLGDAAKADLDVIAADLEKKGMSATRTDAVKFAARTVADAIRRKKAK